MLKSDRVFAALGFLLCFAGTAQAFDADSVEVLRAPDSHYLVTWKQAGALDIFESMHPSAKPSAMRPMAKHDRDGQLDVQITGTRPYFLLRAEDGTTYRAAERLLTLEGGSNFRDLGGYPAANGRHVRWGLLYRSGAMPKLTDQDYQYLSSLGIRVICDLRTVDERQLSPTVWRATPGAQYTSVDYPGEALFSQLDGLDGPDHELIVARLYGSLPTLLKKQYKAIFDDLLAQRAPLAFNCSAGQDRTGIAAGLILSALGTPRNYIYADYLLSTQDRKPANEVSDVDLQKYADTNAAAKFMLAYRAKALQQAAAIHSDKDQQRTPQAQSLLNSQGQPLLQLAFEKIETDYGSIENYLRRELGVTSQGIAKLRTLYLE